MIASPMFHLGGTIGVLSTVWNAGCIAIMPNYTPADCLEFFARERHGPGDPASAVRANEVDVAFGRWTDAGARAAGLRHRLVRLEPLVGLVPDGHPPAGRAAGGACFAVPDPFGTHRRPGGSDDGGAGLAGDVGSPRPQ